MYRITIPALLAALSLTFASGSTAQYRWHITHYGFNKPYQYYFQGVSNAGDVVFAYAMKTDTSLYNDERTGITFFRSTDAGETWVEQDPGLPHQPTDLDDYTIRSIQQIDSLNAVAVGQSGIITRTFDGGQTWHRQDVDTLNTLNAVHFSDSLTGIAVGYGSKNPKNSFANFGCIYITHNGGRHWKRAVFETPVWSSTCHSDGGGAFRVIPAWINTPIYRTTDDWETHDTSSWIIAAEDTLDDALGYAFNGIDTIFCYGTAGIGRHLIPGPPFITYSYDRGTTWHIIKGLPDSLTGPVDTPTSSSQLSNSFVFLAMGENGNAMQLLESTDHGNSWQLDSLRMDDHYLVTAIKSVVITPSGHAIAAFYGGRYEKGQTSITFEPAIGRGDLMPERVYQSPVSNDLFCVVPNPCWTFAKLIGANGSIVLTDALGRAYAVPNTGGTLDVSSLPAGVYYVSNGKQRARFVKE